MEKNYKIVVAATIIVMALFVFWMVRRHLMIDQVRLERPPNKEMIKAAEQLVKTKVTPPSNFSFDFMKPGVLQHIDRQYTYDVVPPELINGFLFQGIHRPPKGTVIEFELLSSATVYFFFHKQVDGGYSEIFANQKQWERSAVFPQYDIHNGNHGLEMVMYKLEAHAGTYSIPPTTKHRACFNIVFQNKAK